MPTYYVNKAFDQASEPQAKEKNGATISGGPPKRRSECRKAYEIDDHRIPLSDLLKRYNSDATRGLRTEQVARNGETFGRNVLTPPKKPSRFLEFGKCLIGGLCALLWGCAFLCFGSYSSQYLFTDFISTDNLFLGCSILIVITVSASFEFYQKFKSDRLMESFKNMVPRLATVTRGGKKFEIPADDLVVGDVVEIKYGDLIPADVRMLECIDFKVDNSCLTGESEPQKRGVECTHDEPMESQNIAFFSTNALEGYAKAIVIRTGSNTFVGQLASLATTIDSGPSPIQKEMTRFVLIMTFRSLLFGGTFFTIAMLMGYDWLDAVFFVIGIVVANVPEGLTVTFTMMLALTAMRMAKINCLVKNVQAVETLGSTSVICSDKTGTLTMNKMSVAHLWYNNDIMEADIYQTVTGNAFRPDDEGFRALANVACLCSKATFRPGDEGVPILKREVNGDASEAAILRYMEEGMGSVIKYRSRYPKLMEIPFNSRNKYQVSIHDMRNPADSRHLLVMKGAPERVINLCDRILIGSTTHPLTAEWREQFETVYANLGGFGERVLGFCDCLLPLEKYPVGYNFDPEEPTFLVEGFRFVGLISMIDPPRPAVPEAVAKCRAAGIKVVMVTGDHPITAKAIARSVGILSPENLTIEEMAAKEGCPIEDIDPATINAAVVTGPELQLLTDQELENLLVNHSEIVFARTSPEQKFTIVDSFQNLGHVVASTGDGVNDSPALKKADIGVAMGISGTEVSKETADMILMDDNFTSIVAGVEQGRLIFDNLKKLICYNLADNIAEMYSVWVFIILGCPLPMGTIAMLLSVCCTDVYPAISITHEKAETDIMKLRPRNPRTQKLVTPQLLSYTYGQTSLFELFSGFFTYFVTMGYNGFTPWRLYKLNGEWTNHAINDLVDSYGQEWSYISRQELAFVAQTSFFASIVMTQISNVIICKTRRLSIFQHGMKNWTMNFAICVELAILAIFIYTPYLNVAINLRPIRWESFIPPIPFMLLMITYDELRRLCIRHTKPGSWIYDEFYT